MRANPVDAAERCVTIVVLGRGNLVERRLPCRLSTRAEKADARKLVGQLSEADALAFISWPVQLWAGRRTAAPGTATLRASSGLRTPHAPRSNTCV